MAFLSIDPVRTRLLGSSDPVSRELLPNPSGPFLTRMEQITLLEELLSQADPARVHLLGGHAVPIETESNTAFEPSVVLQINRDAGRTPGKTPDECERTREANFADRSGVSPSTLYRNAAGPESRVA